MTQAETRIFLYDLRGGHRQELEMKRRRLIVILEIVILGVLLTLILIFLYLVYGAGTLGDRLGL